MEDFKVREKPNKTWRILIFWVLGRGLGEHNLDSRVCFIAKVSSGSIWQVGKQSAPLVLLAPLVKSMLWLQREAGFHVFCSKSMLWLHREAVFVSCPQQNAGQSFRARFSNRWPRPPVDYQKHSFDLY